jgi:hypothetical protein
VGRAHLGKHAATSPVLGPPASIIGSELSRTGLWPFALPRPEACPKTVNTGEHDFGEERVVRWSLGWSNYQRGSNPEQIGENRPHTVEITSEEPRIDVDAFVIAIRRE